MNKKTDRKTIFSWCMYDWANSAFITCITTVILQNYYLSLFKDHEHVEITVLRVIWHTSGLALWAYTSALSMFALILVAPVFGAIADMSRSKKRFLGFCVIPGAVATAAISLVTKGDYLLCSILYIIAYFLWSSGNIFYDGFLPELADEPEGMDSISAQGYGLGYLGGFIALLICACAIFGHGLIGLEEADAMRLTFLIVAIWWFVFTIPLFKNVHEERGKSANLQVTGYVKAGFSRLSHTLLKIRKLPNLGRMLIAFLLYNAGIGTIMNVATSYGKSELNLTDSTLIGVMLAVQILSFPSALMYIKFARKVGTRTSILAGLSIYVIVVVFAMQISTAREFWILGVLISLVQGGTQAMSRSLYGSMIPESMAAEFFGFFSVFNKVGPFFGPLFFGVIKDATGSSRLAILFLVIFFILGFLALLTVNTKKGREEAKAFTFLSGPG